MANHQLWNHVNSLNRKIKKIQHFGKYFLLRSPMHIKSIYTSQDFILQLIQDYLVSKEMTTSQKQLIFQIRTKMIPTPDNMGQETWCKLCLISRDQMSHVLDCFVLRLACQDSYQTTTDVKLSDAYEGDIKKVKELALVFQKMWRKRIELLK